MNLQQIRAVLAIADKGSIREAAKELYLSQSSVSMLLKTVEEEFTIKLFDRSKKGVTLTADGVEFLEYARQVHAQMNRIEELYKSRKNSTISFSVSSQRFDFASDAFAKLVPTLSYKYYDIRFYETDTVQVIEDVQYSRSELGILYLSEFNRRVITQHLSDLNLQFEVLLKLKPNVLLRKTHPLANRETIQLSELEPYPNVTFVQKRASAAFFTEEIFETALPDRRIRMSDRETALDILSQTDSYLMGSGKMNGMESKNIISIPLAIEECSQIGVISKKYSKRSEAANEYIQLLIHEINSL